MGKEKQIELEDQRPNEKVIILRKMHPWVLAKSAMISVLLIALIVLLIYVFRFHPINLIVCLMLLAFLISYFLLNWFSYSSTFFIITNERLIYVNQTSLFHRKVQEVDLSSIYNISYSTEGLWGTVFNFGHVRLNTQGDSDDSITLRDFENPAFIHEKLSRMHAEGPKAGSE